MYSQIDCYKDDAWNHLSTVSEGENDRDKRVVITVWLESMRSSVPERTWGINDSQIAEFLQAREPIGSQAGRT